MTELPTCPDCDARVLDGEPHAPICGLRLAWYQRRCDHDLRPAGGLVSCVICGWIPSDEDLTCIDETWEEWARVEDAINGECHAILKDAGLSYTADCDRYITLFERLKGLANRLPHPAWEAKG